MLRCEGWACDAQPKAVAGEAVELSLLSTELL